MWYIDKYLIFSLYSMVILHFFMCSVTNFGWFTVYLIPQLAEHCTGITVVIHSNWLSCTLMFFQLLLLQVCQYCITVMWSSLCKLIKLHVQWNSYFLNLQGSMKIGSKNWIVWETGCKITVFDWGAERLLVRQEAPKNRVKEIGIPL